MCLFCVELQKENLSAKQVSKLFSELLQSGDKKHLDNYEQIVRSLSEEYKEELNNEAIRTFGEDINDPFDFN